MTGMEWLMAASAGVGALQSISSGIAAKSAGEYNARLAEREAENARQVSAYEEGRARDQARKVLGAQRMAFAKAGVTLEGTPLEVLAETAEEAELDALMIRRAGSVEAARRTSEAALSRRQGRAAMTAGMMGAGARILGGASRIKSLGGDTASGADLDAYGGYG